MAKIPLKKVTTLFEEKQVKFVKKYAIKNNLSEGDVYRMAVEHFIDSRGKGVMYPVIKK